MPYNFTAIEKKWQKYWLDHKTFAALDPAEAGGMPKSYVLDMFPYPSGAGLHMGHMENYTATDIIARYQRMIGMNVLHPTGWDAFGLPAEQYAIKTNRHPRELTETNIKNFRRQIQMAGMSYDWDREVDTTDPTYYKWTQWIFLQLFNSYFDPMNQKAMPIGHLVNELMNENYVVGPDGSVVTNPTQEGMEAITGEVRTERLWRELSPEEQRDTIDGQRLAYTDEIPVNWCPGLGTVLANEEVIDGKSEVGGFPVEKRPLRQWMLRITAYADRLIADLNQLQWPESLKEMQRNWIGRSVGAEVDFEVATVAATPASPPRKGDAGVAATEESEGSDEIDPITVFTTRPDTLYGATYMVLAPEHPLVDRITPAERRETIEAYRTQAGSKSDRDRMTDAKEKTGEFIGAYAINPINDEKIPIYIADYVLMGYGTGAIMAVPAHDERDWEFAKKFDIPIKAVVAPLSSTQSSVLSPQSSLDRPFTNEGVAINSPIINGMKTEEAKEHITAFLAADGVAHRAIKYKLRDWLFSRQRYWGEPFPIVLDEKDQAYAIDESELPLTLPPMEDFKPTGTAAPPLSKAKEWMKYESPRIAMRGLVRETNTMPQWAGSCWYYLRYCDPKNPDRFVDPEKEKYWMPVDLYVGGVEHAVLHLLYARFWHKVLFDLGHVSTREPFSRLVNQGLILGEVEYRGVKKDGEWIAYGEQVLPSIRSAIESGMLISAEEILGSDGCKWQVVSLSAEEVTKRQDGFVLSSNPAIRVDARSFKMSKSRGNVANPDEIIRDYGADAARLYVMYMGPLEQQKPWNTRDIVGMVRFLNAVWRNLVGDEEKNRVAKIKPIAIPEALDRQMHRTIKKVAEDIAALRFNTGIAELIKLNNEITGMEIIPRELAESLTLMLAPFAPHIAEELWLHLGHTKTLARRPWPTFDPAKLVESTMELPVQVNGKLRDKITVAADAEEALILEQAARSEKVVPWLAGKTVKKKLYVPKKLVNFVVG
ncbi:MAG TPA: leucine--tRNA ligase [Tepidisphaeraceae bacterium]|jgi:leucyl-tRNA synthetase|nr:leucine--tRNA ligase [Tepidisphaeraceae bacterium]